MSLPRSERVAVVTGAGSGIGRETAILLGELGYAVVLVGRDAVKLALVQESLPGSEVMTCDMGNAAAVEKLIAAIDLRFGHIDVLVNNAGTTPLKPIEDYSIAEIDEIFRVNAIGPCVAIARTLPIMKRHGGGCIVNVSSMATIDPFPGLYPYAAAKASVNLMARSVVNEAGKHGVRAFAVAPGAVETPLLRSLFKPDAFPVSRTLDPKVVARTIVECVQGKRDADNGKTVFLPSP
jgi:NAD(P)-dependent dehydrogenase (short-subunit alcohol dehydrogenase family)